MQRVCSSLLLLSAVAQASPLVVSNVEPRRDTSGRIVNAHDGALYHIDGHWLLVGTSYAPCESFTNCSSHIGDCGWQDNNFSAYTAPSAAGPWTHASSNLLPQRDHTGANFRPKILKKPAAYAEASGRPFVMWFNFQTPTPNVPGYYVVADAERMEGPYAIVSKQVAVAKALNGDFNLFVDDDETAYIVYNSDVNGGSQCGACHIPPCDCGFQMSVEKLSPDYMSSTKVNSGWIGEPTVEAPAMFKRSNIYYLLFDRLSCFGPQGSGSVVYTSRAAMGPYVAQNNINRRGPFRPGQLGFIIVPAQLTYVAQIGETYVWQVSLFYLPLHFVRILLTI